MNWSTAVVWEHVQMAVLIRPISLEDISSYWNALNSVAQERRHLALLEAPPLAEVEKFVHANIECRRAVHLVAIDSGKVIGWCDVLPGKQPGFTHAGRLGMGIRAEYRRQGIGRRLLAAAVDHALSAGLVRIELEVFSSNLPAIRLYKRFGFMEEGLSRRARYVDGVWDDILRMALVSPPVRRTAPEIRRQFRRAPPPARGER